MEDALRLLEEKGLKMGEISTVNADYPEGIIVAQDPDKDSQVPINTFININKSRGHKELKQLVLPVELPNIKGVILIQVILDGEEVASKNIDPSSLDSNIWRAELKGDGTGKVKILVNGQTYKEISVNFEKCEYSIINDYSSNFQNQ